MTYHLKNVCIMLVWTVVLMLFLWGMLNILGWFVNTAVPFFGGPFNVAAGFAVLQLLVTSFVYVVWRG